jgi:uncharacterized protein (UPF0333 family)
MFMMSNPRQILLAYSIPASVWVLKTGIKVGYCPSSITNQRVVDVYSIYLALYYSNGNLIFLKLAQSFRTAGNKAVRG